MKEVKILIGDKGYVDFEAPVKMSEEEMKKFVNLLETIFDPSVVKDDEPVKTFKRDWRIGEKKVYPRKWTAEEYDILLKCDSINEAMERLGRNWQAVVRKDAIWRYQLIAWCKNRGKNLLKGDKLQIIKEFMKEQEQFKLNKKEIKKKIKNLQKEYEALKKRDTQIKLGYELNNVTKEAFLNHQQEKNNKLKEIKDLEEKLQRIEKEEI